MMKTVSTIFLCSIIPLWAHANVHITEIMYAPEGTDTKHEWIEVCATSTTNIDGWKLFEADTNHGLTLVSGTASLSANGCAIIADDSATFSSDYPSFNGTLFDSAFSLSNTGETISIRSTELVDIDTVSYTDALGAKDDGQSLHRTGDTFAPGTPSPGTEGADASVQTDTPLGATGGTSSSSQQAIFTYEYLSVEPPQDIYVRVEGATTVLRNSNARFSAELYNARGIAQTDGTVYWNFGDGTTSEGRDVTHRFAHEGMYTLSVRALHGTLQDTHTQTITVTAPLLLFTLEDSGIRIQNTSDFFADISGWRIVAGGSYFIMPEHTVISAQSATLFDNSVLKLHQLLQVQQIVVYTPDGILFADVRKDTPQALSEVHKPLAQEFVQVEPTPSVISENTLYKKTTVAPAVSSLVGTRVPTQLLKPEGSYTPVSSSTVALDDILPEIQTSYSSELGAVSISDSLPDDTLWWVTVSILIVVGTAGIFVARSSFNTADSFTIQEE